MTTDRYTKAVLTIIAIALSVIALQYSIPAAFAQSNRPIKVWICDVRNPDWCADVGTSGGLVVEPKR